MIIGYMNARTNNESDYTLNCKSEVINSIFEDSHPHTDRKNCDLQTNHEGLKLINLCKSFDLIILNGRRIIREI